MTITKLLHHLAALLFLVGAFAPPSGAQILGKPVLTTAQTRAELMAFAPQGLAPGQPVWVALQLTHQPHWHSYWKNPGDSGLSTVLQWTLPAGVSASDIGWPIPQKIPLGNLVNYGYEGRVLLPVALTLSPEFKPLSDSLRVQLKASWLVCKLECIPEEGQFELTIPTRSSSAVNASIFEAAFAAQPTALNAANSQIEIVGSSLKFSISGLPASWRDQTLALFPETPGILNPASPLTQAWQGANWTAQLALSAQRSTSPSVLPLLLEYKNQGLRIEVPVQGTWPPVAQRSELSPALQAALQNNSTLAVSTLSLSAALLGALLGGLLLNLMPCVFPVLAIKVVNFARHADDRRSHRISGLAYSAGVILSFVALALLLLGLRAAGQSLGWGFQLQNPAVVAALAALFTLIALNLCGLFEFAQFLPSSWATFQARHPVLDSFLTGVLAVAVASPCSAPFMGASLGFAVSLPAPQALFIFATLGFGLALPYLLASFVPAFARVLPRPGPWMLHLRHFLAFPMFATVAWLVWVLGQQSGIDGAGALLALLVLLGAFLWSLTLRGPSRLFSTSLLLALAAFSLWTLGPNVVKLSENSRAEVSDSLWQPWQPGRVEQLLENKQTVFVDFSAAWCVSCQYNKTTTLSDPALLAEFRRKNINLLRADWTRRDPAITAALRQLGRNGVPVYVIYQHAKPPLLLSEILSVGEVRAALATLPN